MDLQNFSISLEVLTNTRDDDSRDVIFKENKRKDNLNLTECLVSIHS